MDTLQQKKPHGVGQWIGGRLEVHASMPEVRRENRHDAIQRQIAGVRLPVPNWLSQEVLFSSLSLIGCQVPFLVTESGFPAGILLRQLGAIGFAEPETSD
jgi:hypothetical protein